MFVKIRFLVCLLAVMIGYSQSQGDCFQIVAHRGASFDAPENTLAAFAKAWQQDADAVECDVHLTSDNKIVVIHDYTTKRTSSVDMQVSNTDSGKLRQLDVGSFKGESFKGEKIPYLSEVIELLPADKSKQLFVEIKCGKEILPHLSGMLEDLPQREQIVLISFNFDVLAQAKQLMPDIPAFWLVGTAKDEETKEWIPHNAELIKKVKEMGIDGLDVNFAGLTKEFANMANDAGLELQTWTVDDIESCKAYCNMGLSGVTTNRPEPVKKAIEEMKSHKQVLKTNTEL